MGAGLELIALADVMCQFGRSGARRGGETAVAGMAAAAWGRRRPLALAVPRVGFLIMRRVVGKKGASAVLVLVVMLVLVLVY